MHKNVKLLDCTLRDGGYVNDWNFGHSTIVSTYKRLDASGVEFIEVGFLDERREFDINRTIVPNTDCYNRIFKDVKKGNASPVAMIDYGTCSIENISDCENSFIDCIRVIFKKDKINEALPFCKTIKDKGYKLFIQAISITSYSDKEMVEYIEKINEVKPYAFSIVDTYGLLDKKKLSHYFNLFDNNLEREIIIGYHAHNNFQLAFSNTITFYELDTKREIIADSTVYGMGKSAGNCPSELISMYLNDKFEKAYDICQFLEVLDTDLMPIYQKYYWGYKYNFFISAMQNCHPSYVQYLLDKKTLTVSSVNEILCKIPVKDKLLYSQNLIEEMYIDYQSNTIDDCQSILNLTNKLKDKKILLIGPGSSISKNEEHIKRLVNDDKVVVIAVNFASEEMQCDYVFLSNAKRYNTFSDRLGGKMLPAKLILTSNITPFDCKADYMLNYHSLMECYDDMIDNALLLCLAALKKMAVKKVDLAGFDGFSLSETDYYDESYSFAGNEAYKREINVKVTEILKRMQEDIKINFVTDSIYQKGLE